MHGYPASARFGYRRLFLPDSGVPADTLLYDTFTGADGVLVTAHTPDIGGPWVGADGWTIQSERAACSGPSARIVLCDVGASEVRVSTRFYLGSGNFHSLFFASSAPVSGGTPADGFFIENEGNLYRLRRRVSGSTATAETYDKGSAPVAGELWLVEMSASNIKFSIDGTLRIDYTPGSPWTLSQTHVGIRYGSAGSVAFDDFLARPL